MRQVIRQKFILNKIRNHFNKRSIELDTLLNEWTLKLQHIEEILEEEIDKYNGNKNKDVIQQILSLDSKELKKIVEYKFINKFTLGLDVADPLVFIQQLQDLKMILRRKTLVLQDSFKVLYANEEFINNKLKYNALLKERNDLQMIANIKKLNQFSNKSFI